MLPKPTRPAPPMPAIKQPAVDYRALLVRYMQMVMNHEGVSFVDCTYEPNFSAAEIDALHQIEEEVEALLEADPEFVEAAALALQPKFSVWLRGEEVQDVLSFVEYDDGKGKTIAVERYARDSAGNLINTGGTFLTETILDDFELRRTEPCE